MGEFWERDGVKPGFVQESREEHHPQLGSSI